MRVNYQKALAVNPWLFSYPVYLETVRPVIHNKQHLLVDPTGEVLPINSEYQNFYSLLAISGGAPIAMFGEFDGYQFYPLSVVTGMGLVEA